MKDYSRVSIEGLSQDQAIELAKIIKSRGSLAKFDLPKNSEIEIDHPDPPLLFEAEYEAVYDAIGRLADLSYPEWEAAESLKEVERDIRSMRALVLKVAKELGRVQDMVDNLEAAAFKKK